VADARLRAADRAPGALVAVAYAPGVGAAVAVGALLLSFNPTDAVRVLEAIGADLFRAGSGGRT
jgi:hypothetical protein